MITIGMCGPPKKMQQMFLPLIEHCQKQKNNDNNSVHFCILALDDDDITTLPRVDVLFHKVVQDIAACETSRMQRLDMYIEKWCPKMFCTPAHTAVFTRRDDTYHILQKNVTSIRTPRVVLTPSEVIGFPVIVKTIVACGVEASHHMLIAFSHEQIPPHPALPMVYQTFIPHDALLKVYVAGSGFVKYVVRRALRPDEAMMTFNSQCKTFKQALDVDVPADIDARVRYAAREIVTAFGVGFIGFDVLWEYGSPGALSVVDVNYLPSYSGIDGAYDAILSELVAL